MMPGGLGERLLLVRCQAVEGWPPIVPQGVQNERQQQPVRRPQFTDTVCHLHLYCS